ncbi:MAG TPA: threonine--tRNA ligase [Candidatus Dormibacteraeota bacterium]|nr:threonine--tRNA ligase [Candidatus Dormibacteraeota bacterium]
MPDDIVDDSAEAGPPLAVPAELTLDILRHSAAHLMAAAVVELYPGAEYDVGPATEEGFFYNFRLPDGAHFVEEDLSRIEARMRELAKRRIPFEREVMSRDEARRLFSDLQQTFKVDIIDRMGDEVAEVGIYRTGDFIDLCRGPHVAHSGRLRTVKLLRVAGVYWRGDERNEQLQRVYGTAFFEREQLDAFIAQREEARRRDHRRLGVELDLFHLSEHSPGSPFWHPNGMVIWNTLEDLRREENRKRGYLEVKTPLLFDVDTYKTSGHYENYAENIFFVSSRDEGTQFALKPMNCPGHMLLFGSGMRSYRELPIRYAESSTLHRDERSGTLHGLLRVRHITQDDAHIFCTDDQIQDEIHGMVEYANHLYAMLGVTPRAELSTRPEKRLGTEDQWDRAESALEQALQGHGMDYVISPGEGTFYGPKIDLHMTDSIGRSWQMGTIQLDYQMPSRFGLSYVGADGQDHTPVVIHRALLGSLERCIGILTEHYAGHFPLWLAPVQCEIVPVQDDAPEVVGYAHSLREVMRAAGIRATVSDKPGQRMQARIRDAMTQKVPYVVVVGRNDLERGDDVVNVRSTRAGTQENMAVAELVARMEREVAERIST